ncbi:MAG: hypothetical protein OEZ34_03050 [Spirochaetia bacterium]|nr:hypothetical protein [Spirochaetia bacterium]
MDLIVWFILCTLFSSGLIIFHHWMELFSSSDSISKEELTGIPEIFRRKINAIPDPALFFTGYGIGIFLSWLLVLFGGMVSPDLTVASDYGENTPANYFFQSFLFPILLAILWPAFIDLLPEGSKEKLSSAGNGLFYGSAVSLAALNFSIWGVFHQTRFLFIFLNAAVLLIFALYKLNDHFNQKHRPESEENPFQEDFTEDSQDFLSDEDLEL